MLTTRKSHGLSLQCYFYAQSKCSMPFLSWSHFGRPGRERLFSFCPECGLPQVGAACRFHRQVSSFSACNPHEGPMVLHSWVVGRKGTWLPGCWLLSNCSTGPLLVYPLFQLFCSFLPRSAYFPVHLHPSFLARVQEKPTQILLQPLHLMPEFH